LRRRVHAGRATCGGHAGRLWRRLPVPGLLLGIAWLLLRVARLLLGIAGLLPIAGLLLRIAGLLAVAGLAISGLPVSGLSLLPPLGILRRGLLLFASAHGGENERGGHQTASQ
jgi:hypothetical protein